MVARVWRMHRHRPAEFLSIDYPRVKLVGSFDELLSARFQDGVNAFRLPRTLPHGFGEVVAGLTVGPGITTLDDSRLIETPVTEVTRPCIDFILKDLRLLRAHGLDPALECVNGYLAHDEPGPVRTDVCSFHVDTATDEADTYLCTYHGASSEGLRNEDAQPRVDCPETRAELLKLFGGKDDDTFDEFLEENFFDLHYAAVPGARPFSFGVGNLWRIAVKYPGSPVPPCIHRAPDPIPGQPPRLLLIS